MNGYLDRFMNWGSGGYLGNGGVLDNQAGHMMAMDTGTFNPDLTTAAPASWQNSLPSESGFTPSFMQGATGYTNPDGTKVAGWGGLALGAAKGLAGSYLGMKQYGLAKDSLKEGKRQFNLNYNAQKQSVNTQLEDRQRARVASNAGAYQSVGSYMNENRIK